jgi:hypothetical protein
MRELKTTEKRRYEKIILAIGLVAFLVVGWLIIVK